jgi:hypothetical protein
MSKIRNIVMAGALAFATAVPVIAEAGPMPGPVKVEKTTDVTSVRVVCGRWRCHRGGWRGRYWGPRRVWVAPRVYIAPRRVYVAPRVVIRGGGWNAHVRWCMNRYASYNPNNNTFLAYDGYYKRCNSPYR